MGDDHSTSDEADDYDPTLVHPADGGANDQADREADPRSSGERGVADAGGRGGGEGTDDGAAAAGAVREVDREPGRGA